MVFKVSEIYVCKLVWKLMCWTEYGNIFITCIMFQKTYFLSWVCKKEVLLLHVKNMFSNTHSGGKVLVSLWGSRVAAVWASVNSAICGLERSAKERMLSHSVPSFLPDSLWSNQWRETRCVLLILLLPDLLLSCCAKPHISPWPPPSFHKRPLPSWKVRNGIGKS